jgi:hypothetical protein
MINTLSARQRVAVAALLLAVWALLLRVPALDQFVTADEHAWLARSGNFYYALAHGDWAGTFQRHHPGVTVTWAGLGGYLLTFPGYAAVAPGQFGWLTEEIEPFLRSQGHDPLAVLAAGRLVSVLLITLTLTGCYLIARRLLDEWTAFLGMALIVFAPFHIAHSRLLHLDGLVSSLMLLAVLAWIDHLRTGARGTLAAAATAAGLAWLTRSPALFLLPLFALLALLKLWRDPTHPWPALLRSTLIGGLGGVLLFVLLWPAMWVDPVGSLRAVLSAAGDYAAEGHLKPIFFNGEIFAGDPGWTFYPLAYLWRITPITGIGLLAALVAWARRADPFRPGPQRAVLGALLLYALGFILFMNLGAKKFDRYILPAHLPLEILAAAGWVALLGWARRRGETRGRGHLWPLAAGSVILGQALFVLPFAPYYLSFYNPALGGSRVAPAVMMIGWGEGADQAGRYLDAKPHAAGLRVASGYTNGPLSYFFRGETLPLTFWYHADYAALFIQDFQRQLPSRRTAAEFGKLTPEAVFTLNGIDYAYLYDLRAAYAEGALPDSVIDWGGVIRLISFQLPAAPIAPGETVRVAFYLLNTGTIATNLNVLVRVVGPGGQELARSEGWPWGAATSSWSLGETWPDGHDLHIPADAPPGHYRVEVGFYDPATGALLSATQANNGAALGDLVTLDTIQVGRLPTPRAWLNPPVDFGDLIRLRGAERADGRALGGHAARGETLDVRLFWEARAWVGRDYTAFVHLVGPDGTLVDQMDRAPLEGFLPTSLWYPGQTVVDRYRVTLPPDAAPGRYTLYTGFYTADTITRLPVMQGDASLGDAFRVGEVTVE